MANSWLVQIDWDNDGSFTTSGDDISAYVQHVDIQLGTNNPWSLTASVGTAALTLNNTDRRFSPANAASPLAGKLTPNRPIRVQVTDGVTTWTAFRGYTRAFSADSGIYGQKHARVECVDTLALLQDATLSLPLQQAIASGTLIKHIVNAALQAPVASGKITLTAAPANNDTITLNGAVYKFVTSLSGNPNEILISALYGSLQAMIAAINGASGVGTIYGNNSTPAGVMTAAINAFTACDVNNQDSDVLLRNTTAPVKDKLAEQFQVSGAVSISSAVLYLKAIGAPTGTLTLRIETDSGGSPSGSLINPNATATVAESSLTPSYGLKTFAFAGNFALQPSVVYWLVLSTSRAASATNYIAWGADATGPSYAYQNNSGMKYNASSAWSLESKTAIFIIGELSATLTATLRGAVGNGYTLAKSGSGITLSGATLSGGADYPTSPAPSIQAGRQTFDVAADRWSSGKTNGLSAIQQVIDSEQGRFWAARDGTLTFKDRDYVFKQIVAAVALALNGETTDISGTQGQDDLYNVVRVQYTPRAALASGVVAQSKGNIEVTGLFGTERWNPTAPANGNMLVVKLPFTDPATGQPMGAKSIITPLVPGTDYTVYDNPAAGAGFNYTNNGVLQISAAINGNDVELSFVNNALGKLYVQTLQVRGVGIVSYNPTTAAQEDSASQISYQRRVLNLTLPLPSGQAFAQALAAYLLSRYKAPAYRVKSISFQKQTTVGGVNLYSLELGHTLTLSDAQLGVAAGCYLIIGLRYKRAIGSAGDVTFTLWRLDDVAYGLWDDATYGVWDSARWGI